MGTPANWGSPRVLLRIGGLHGHRGDPGKLGVSTGIFENWESPRAPGMLVLLSLLVNNNNVNKDVIISIIVIVSVVLVVVILI